ncbi:hypothetical protein SAMN04489760_108115 [Syntrophus gentianae]|uniref:VPLPA-CTERM protein sorting domain-containing protein n=1 Tax=Syntrophus gentianae TaxID=43775 RepID=A0A1H7WYZ4_9BACT|nr:hypothetical protein [Syntrophus gentianae]SEM26753.1 hypothetical protein SAMN04489760_108115 [Syntrophus gentianae]
MKKHAILFLILVVLFIAVPSFASVTNYFGYTTYGGTWSDADKTYSNSDDDYMCWAAAASNILSWAGWSTSLYSSADSIFAAFQEYWTDQGGLMSYGWDWWFTGATPSYGTSASYVYVSGGGGYYKSLFESLSLNFADYYHEETNAGSMMSAIATYLTSGYGTTIGIYKAIGNSITGHALTVWGYAYDGNEYTGIWVTDSDDYGSSDSLTYYDVEYKNGKWYLEGYNGYYIGVVEALDRNTSSSAVPIPAAIWLFSSGLLGLIGFRKKIAH